MILENEPSIVGNKYNGRLRSRGSNNAPEAEGGSTDLTGAKQMAG